MIMRRLAGEEPDWPVSLKGVMSGERKPITDYIYSYILKLIFRYVLAGTTS